MKHLLTILFVMFLLVAGIGHSAPTTVYYERSNGDGTSSYYGFSQTPVVESWYGLLNTDPTSNQYVGNDVAPNAERYFHDSSLNVSIDSTSELLWIMENMDMLGANMWQRSNKYAAIALISGQGAILGTNTTQIATAALALGIADQRTGTGAPAILVPLDEVSWVLRDGHFDQYGIYQGIFGYAMYEIGMESGLLFISDNSGLHSVVSAPAPAVIPAPGALLLLGIGCPIVGWLRRRRSI